MLHNYFGCRFRCELLPIFLTDSKLRNQELIQTTMALGNFNDYSSREYGQLQRDLDRYTRMMKEMKKDLTYIFKKIKTLKEKTQEKYPYEYAQMVQEMRGNNVEEEEDS
ncbi:hypothetical protein PROFUN_01955 [Planoprotostelium fungivorum]|uniref:KxDL domain-containing protein n=1 Tax=Planoprotostelium fungivorum TaxID=1890364 RepID=A0A2P6NAZ8_9EUKA|nr:hypothetical protein PROFUN_01955 [Planoprotostelium fungivorum]